MRAEVDVGDAVHAVGRELADGLGEVRPVGVQDVRRAERMGPVRLPGADHGDHGRPAAASHLGGDGADAADRAVDEHVQPVHRPVGEHRAVAGDAGDAEAGRLLGQPRVVVDGDAGSATARSAGTTTYCAAVPNGR